jgi:NADH-quinone oxidoreductase subunit G
VQRANRAVFPPGQAREDWAIIRALSEVMGKPLPYNTLEELRARMTQLAPHLAHVGSIVPAQWKQEQPASNALRISDRPFHPRITNFYMTDPISRESSTMAECTRSFIESQSRKVA